jgi:hypothetical protein
MMLLIDIFSAVIFGMFGALVLFMVYAAID